LRTGGRDELLFVGDDWAEDHHDVELQDETGRRLGKARLEEGIGGIARLHAMLGEQLSDDDEPGQVVVGIETDRGPWVQPLIAAGYQVYAINPLQVARYREWHAVSGAKSDAGDEYNRQYDQFEGQEAALALEKLQRYPFEREETAPTLMGNRIRAFELYGFDRYGIDSQSLWYELETCAPERNSQAISQARAGVDFFVCVFYLTAILGAFCLISGSIMASHPVILFLVGAVGIASLFLWYRLAVVAMDQWAAAVQALVNLGRKPLAEAMGLHLPQDSNDERRMWELANWLVRGQLSRDGVSKLDEFRRDVVAQTSATVGGSSTPIASTAMVRAGSGGSSDGQPNEPPGSIGATTSLSSRTAPRTEYAKALY
jgi:hypothetical protein